jgi:hypothetical protein
MKKIILLIVATSHSAILFSQNVGIGTISPLEKLSVFTNYGYGISHEANSIKLSSYIDGGGAYLGTISNHPFHVYTNNGAAQATFSTNGFLGLGNMSPEYRLDITGRMRIRTGTIGNIFTTSGVFMEDYRNGSPRIFLGMQDSIRLGFYGDGTPGIAWGFNFNARNGNVGIGVSNPVNKLEVDGNIKANSFTFNTPKTSYYSMPPSSFIVKSTRLISSEFADIYMERDGYGGSVFQYLGNSYGFVAPVNLPHGVTVTGLKVFFVDNSSTDNLTFQLKRRLHEGEFYLAMCTLTSSGTPGNSNISSTTIGFPVIDNLNYNYTLTAVPEPDGYWGGTEFQIKSVLITYTVPAAE